MFVPRIWKRESAQGSDAGGNPIAAFGWGWSESSEDEASTRAKKTAERIIGWLSSGKSTNLDHYGYDKRLPREEIIEEYRDAQEQTHAFISRNSYGCLILNTRDLMFIDVDVPRAKTQPSAVGLIASFVRKEANQCR